jgi:class 3 adenylate cyclase/predicted ATPase
MPARLAQKISTLGKQIEGERRNVTVLFADISGFTAIAEKLDPEHVYNFINQTLQAFIDQVYQHEGTIDKVMGDGVMALFGAPIAHEDDPARAVRAALGMQDALHRINADLEPQLGIALRVRIGLHTGPVVVGSIGSDLRMEYTALGDTVNVASRLENIAEPGTIVVSRAVYEATKPLFEFGELGSIRVKNRIEPVEIFQVLAPRRVTGRVRGIPGLSAPMIGRETEFARVRQAADELITQRRGKIVLVTGNAGIGKSRLTSELKNYLADKWVTILEGACLAYGQPAYGVFLQILRALFDIRDGDAEEIAREKIETGIQRLVAPSHIPAVLPYIEHLFSIRIFEREMATRIRHLTPPQLQQQTFIAIRDVLTAQAQQKPLLLFLEDIHWLDPLSLELLTFLLPSVEDLPLMIYGNSRLTEGIAATSILRVGTEMYAPYFVHIPLAPLSQADSVALVDLLLSIHDLPPLLREQIPQHAEGNPFYLEEIIRMLIDRGIIRRGEKHWEVTPGADIDHLQVPTTLQGLIMARVDSLSEHARHTLQCAAVIGRNFSHRLLNNVVEDAHTLAEDLAELEERQLIVTVSKQPEAEYRFAHVLIQDTVYQSLLVRRREYLHHKIASSIETLFKNRLDEYIEQLAFHYSQSNDLDRALPYVIRAGQHAEERFANDQALRHYQAAAEFLTRTHPTLQQKIDVYMGLGQVQTFTGDYAGATTSYLIALEMVRSSAKSIETLRQSAEVMRRLGRVCERRGDYAEALRWLENAWRELESDPNEKSVERVRVLNDLGWVQYRRGEFDQAYEMCMRTLQVVEGTEHYNEMASAYNRLVALFTRQGDWARASAYAEKGLRLRERIGDLHGVSQSYTNLGVIAWEQNQWNQALEYIERSLDIKQKTGDIEGIALLHNNLSELYREKGDYRRASELGEQALSISEKIKNGNKMCQALNNLAHIMILQNEFGNALPYLERCLALATQMGSKERLAEAKWLMAQAQLGQGHVDTAEQLANEAFTLAQQVGKRYQASIARTLAQIALAQKQFALAHQYIEQSITLWTSLKNRFELAKSHYQLGMILRAEGEFDRARAILTNALDTFSQLGATAERERAQHALAQLTENLNHPT